MKRYLLYAFGEIILVMIGILLALQVNNWNNQQTNRQLEEKILKEIHQEFLINKKNFEHVTSRRITALETSQKIIDMFPIDLKEENLDSISYYLKTISNRSTFNPANGAINTLSNSSSFNIISNEKLRALLMQWKVLLEDYLEDERIADHHIVNQWDPYMNGRFIQRYNHVPKIEEIYDERVDLSFLESIEFQNHVIRRMLNLRRSYNPNEEITEYERIKKSINEIIELTK